MESIEKHISQSHSAVCAVIVIYQPDITRLSKVIDSLYKQVHQIVVINNGVDDEAEAWIELKQREKYFHVISHGINKGLGAAHNTGFAWAINKGYARFLLLDQDSIPDADMVSRLSFAINQLLLNAIPVAAVGAEYIDSRTGQKSKLVRIGPTFGKKPASTHLPPHLKPTIEKVDFLISSGSLFLAESLQHIGHKNEDLFIDHVDTEWFFRARSLGYTSYLVTDARMDHRLGDTTIRLWVGRWRHMPLYSPDRYYYIFRNSIFLYKTTYTPNIWKIKDILKLCGIFCILMVIMPERMRYIRMIYKGVKDGVLGRYGKLAL